MPVVTKSKIIIPPPVKNNSIKSFLNISWNAREEIMRIIPNKKPDVQMIDRTR